MRIAAARTEDAWAEAGPSCRALAGKLNGPAATLARGGAVLLLGFDHDGRERCILAADAATVTAASVNQMARAGRGIVSCAVGEALAARLGLALLPRTTTAARPLFMRSVEARSGVSTGISAADRAATLRAIGSPRAGAADLVSPGHVMPDLVQSGTRASDPLPAAVLPRLAAVAGINAAAWCDLLDDDGEVAGHRTGRAVADRLALPLIG